VVDVASRTVVGTVELGTPYATFLYGVAVAGDRVYVTSGGGNYDGSEENIFVVDATSLRVIDTFEITGGFSRPALRDDGEELVVARGFPDNDFSASPRIVVLDEEVGRRQRLREARALARLRGPVETGPVAPIGAAVGLGRGVAGRRPRWRSMRAVGAAVTATRAASG
jgi:DNA-binding beta-propeller fold protein YncE